MATSSDKYKKLPVVDSAETSKEASPPPYAVQVVQPGVSKLSFDGVHEEPRMNHIYFAIFAMICCFWPLGLVAIIKAIRGMQAIYHGDQVRATALNKSSKKWSIASVVVGVCLIIGFYALAVLARVIPGIVASALNKNGTESYHGHDHHGHDHYHHGHGGWMD